MEDKMSIAKLPSGHYRVRIYVKGKLYNKTFNTLNEAEEYQSFIKRNREMIGKAENVLNEDMTISVKVDNLLEGYGKKKQQYINDELCKIDKMSGAAFEEYCLMLLEISNVLPKSDFFKTRTSGDYGADIIINHSNKVKVSVQCKRLKDSPVRIEAIQEVVGSKKFYHTNKCMVITNSRFTDNAVSLALANDVLLIDRERLIKLIELKYENGRKIASGKYWEELCEMFE